MFFRTAKLVDKSQDKFLEFPEINVLEHKIDQVNEFIRLRKVFFLRNLNKETFQIFFTDHTGLKKVEASIWTISEKAIILKNTTVVPFSDIVAVA